jgi:hypothetical protein
MDIQQNYARIGTAEIDRLFDETSQELDRDKAHEMANRLDAMPLGRGALPHALPAAGDHRDEIEPGELRRVRASRTGFTRISGG